MKKKYQNIFFILGLVLLGIMLAGLDYRQTWQALQHAGYWAVAVIVLWAFLYIFNTSAWMIIIRSQDTPADRAGRRISFGWLYKITVSGFALNYTTPVGLMGGEPYRIMELTPKLGPERATSSVLLYAMTHIFSHFWFWLVSILLFIITKPLNSFTATILVLTAVFSLSAIWFFLTGYKKGLAVRMMTLLGKIPGVRRRVKGYVESHKEQLDNIDRQIASLHNQNTRTFISVVLLELTCRLCSALEVFFILSVLYSSVNYIDCILIIAFTTLIANMLFFIPLQLGGREGGFLMSITGLGLTSGAGIFVALIVRIRELIWTALGLILIKIENRRKT